jgi:predicted HicB family RNase H-like nuclease
VRLSKHEKEEFEKAAVKKGLSLSDWMRQALKEAVEAQ